MDCILATTAAKTLSLANTAHKRSAALPKDVIQEAVAGRRFRTHHPTSPNSHHLRLLVLNAKYRPRHQGKPAKRKVKEVRNDDHDSGKKHPSMHKADNSSSSTLKSSTSSYGHQHIDTERLAYSSPKGGLSSSARFNSAIDTDHRSSPSQSTIASLTAWPSLEAAHVTDGRQFPTHGLTSSDAAYDPHSHWSRPPYPHASSSNPSLQ